MPCWRRKIGKNCENGGAWRRLCTKYDEGAWRAHVRCTIAKFARVARDAEQRRRLSYEAVIGRGYKADGKR